MKSFFKHIIILQSLFVCMAVVPMDDAEVKRIKGILVAEAKKGNLQTLQNQIFRNLTHSIHLSQAVLASVLLDAYAPATAIPRQTAVTPQPGDTNVSKIVATYGYNSSGELGFVTSDPTQAKILAILSAKANVSIPLAKNPADIVQADTVLTFFLPDGRWGDNLPVVAQQLHIARKAQRKVVINFRYAFHPRQAEEQIGILATDSGIVQNKLKGFGHQVSTFHLMCDTTKKELFNLPGNTQQLDALVEVLKK